MPPSIRYRLLLCSLGLLSVSMMAKATDELRFSGFATIGVASNDDEQLEFRRDITQENGSRDGQWRLDIDSLLGLQWNLKLNEQWDATAQLVLRDRAKQSLGESLEWAFLRYRWRDGSDLRIGRLGLDIYMLSDYRYVGYAYPWVRPVPDFYGIVPLFHFDGIDYSHRFDFDTGSLWLKVFAGRSDSYFPTDDDEFKLTVEPGWGFTLLYEQEPWRVRLSSTRVELNSELPNEELHVALAAAAPLWPHALDISEQLRLKGAKVDYDAIGFTYDNNRWLVQSEFAHINGNRPTTPSSRSAYLSVGHRIGAFTPFLIVSGAEPDDPPSRPSLPPLPPPFAAMLEPLRAASELALNNTRLEQRGVGVGLRWDFLPQKSLKLQWDRWQVDADGRVLWRYDLSEPLADRIVNVISLSMDTLL